MGASLDGSPASVFKALGEMAKRAGTQVSNELARSGEPLGKSVKSNAVKAERAIAELRAKLGGGDLMNPATRSIKQFGDDAKSRFDDTKRRFKELTREVEKGARDIERAEKQASKAASAAAAKDARNAGRQNAAFHRGVTRVAGNVARGALSGAVRLAGDVASGSGVDLDVASHVARNVDLQAKAIDLANAGYMPGAAGPNGQRTKASDLEAQARDVANTTAIAPTEAIEGLQAFVSKTGDLATGRDILKDMAVLAKATGSSLEDMVDAAGDVSNNLGDMPNKGAAVAQVMQAFAAQGKLGAVEIKDMAVQMAKVAAAAGQFGGDKAKNIIMLGAIAQEARQRGGSSSAASSATAVTSFANTFSKGARLKAFKSFGVDTTDASGAQRDPQAVIMDAIRAASSKGRGGLGAMQLNMGQMFADVQARRATKGFESIYRDTYSSTKGTDTEKAAAGMAAVAAEFERLKNAQMGLTEITTSFRAAMDDAKSKAQLMNNASDAVTKKFTDSLAPTIDAMGPILTSAANDVTDFATGLIRWLSGADDADKEHANAAAYNAATRDTRVLTHAIKGAEAGKDGGLPTVKVAEGTIEQAREDKLAILMAKKRAQKELEDVQKNVGLNPTSDSDKKKLADAQSLLASYKAEFDKLSTVLTQLTNGTMKVEVVKSVAPPAPAPKVDGKGQQPVSQ